MVKKDEVVRGLNFILALADVEDPGSLSEGFFRHGRSDKIFASYEDIKYDPDFDYSIFLKE